MPEPLSEDHAKAFLRLAELLLDEVLNGIPEAPQFCKKSDGGWRVLDSNTLKSMEEQLQAHRDIRRAIYRSGSTGVGYILSALTAEDSDVFTSAEENELKEGKQPLINILKKWHDTMPAERKRKNRAENLQVHEQKLNIVDMFLNARVWEALPPEVQEIPRLIEQFEKTRVLFERWRSKFAEKKVLLESETADGDDITVVEDELCQIEEEMGQYCPWQQFSAYKSQLSQQIANAKSIRDSINADELKVKANDIVKIEVVLGKETGAYASTLLDYDPNSPTQVLTEKQLEELVNDVVKSLISRNYSPAPQEEGELMRYLLACRLKQSEWDTTAEGSLTTYPVDGNFHRLTPGRVRDPSDRTQYLDCATRQDAANFCAIIIGACLHAVEVYEQFQLPACIVNFLEEHQDYSINAKSKFDQFRQGTLKLVDSQQQILTRALSAIPVVQHGHFRQASQSPKSLVTLNEIRLT